MSYKKSRKMVLYEDAKARLKHQTLMQDYHDLQNEADVMRSKLEAAKQRKLTLAAEVRFLRRRYKYLSRSKPMGSSLEQNLVHARNSLQQTKSMKEHLVSKKESRHGLPLIPDPKPKKHNIGKQVVPRGASPIIDRPRKKILHLGKETAKHSLTPVSDLNRKGRIQIKRRALARDITPIVDLNQNGRMHGGNDANLRNSIVAFDLNQDSSSPSGREASLPSRAPIFDLNEISTGDEDFQSNVEAVRLEEVKKGLIRGVNDEQQNDLKLSICRNAGEGSSRVGKRKISWQDPVALRV